MSIDEEMPYVIINPETDEPLIIIDTTGKYTSLETTPSWALLTKTSLILKKSETETRIFELSEIDSLIVDQDTVYGWIETIRKVAAIVLYPFALLGSFVYRILQVLLYAAIGLVIAKNAEIPLDYSSLVSLAIVANSPSILVNTLYNYLDIAIPLWWLICFALSMGYLVFGIKACAEEKTSVAHS